MKEEIKKGGALATYGIDAGIITIYATLPSGKRVTHSYILDVLRMKCISIYDLEFGVTDDDGFIYYFSISLSGQDMICYARSY